MPCGSGAGLGPGKDATKGLNFTRHGLNLFKTSLRNLTKVINCGTVHPLLADFCTAASSLPNLNDRIMLFGFTFMLLSTQSGLRVVLGVCIGAHGCVSAASLSSCGSFCSSSSGESSPAACSGQ